MDEGQTARDRADAQFVPTVKHGDKGSAVSMIAAESRAVNEKTSRLKALRLARDATQVAAEPEPAPKAKAKKPAAAKKTAAPKKAKPAS